jgi:hypothetical protein
MFQNGFSSQGHIGEYVVCTKEIVKLESLLNYRSVSHWKIWRVLEKYFLKKRN